MPKISPKNLAQAIFEATEGKSDADLTSVLKRSAEMLGQKRLLGKSKDILQALQDIIDKKEAIELFQAYGLKIKVPNHFTYRLFHGETNKMWDWYHTTGTLHKHEGRPILMGKVNHAEDVALLINREE